MSCMQTEATPGDRPQRSHAGPPSPMLCPRGSPPIAIARGPLCSCRCGCWLPEVDAPAGGAWVRVVSQNPELCSLRVGGGRPRLSVLGCFFKASGAQPGDVRAPASCRTTEHGRQQPGLGDPRRTEDRLVRSQRQDLPDGKTDASEVVARAQLSICQHCPSAGLVGTKALPFLRDRDITAQRGPQASPTPDVPPAAPAWGARDGQACPGQPQRTAFSEWPSGSSLSRSVGGRHLWGHCTPGPGA